MESSKSGKKVLAFQGITVKSVKFLTDLQEVMSKLKVSTEAIAVPAFDEIYNGFVEVTNNANELMITLSDEMRKMAQSWGERKGFGAKHEEAFADLVESVKAIHNSTFKLTAIELSDGLNENVSEETVNAFTNNLIAISEVKDPFIYGIGEIAAENSTPDTENIYSMIGSGLETFTNSIVDVLIANESEIKKFGVSLEECVSSVKKQASEVVATGSQLQGKVKDFNAGL